jgi:hypothetical protein
VQLLAQIRGTGANAFAGNTGDNGTSGPDGINAVGNLIYAGDVNSVKVIDPVAQAVIKTITVGNAGKRADVGCVDPGHNLFMISSPEAPVPFASIINTATRTPLGACAVEGREAKCAKAEDSLGAATSPGWFPGRSR